MSRGDKKSERYQPQQTDYPSSDKNDLSIQNQMILLSVYDRVDDLCSFSPTSIFLLTLNVAGLLSQTDKIKNYFAYLLAKSFESR